MSTFREHPKAIGDRSVAKILARLIDVFDSIAIPFGENTRYDLLGEARGRFLRIQCKTGRLKDGAVGFPTTSVYFHHPAVIRGQRDPTFSRRGYRGEADLFAVYCPDNDAVYLVPVKDVPVGKARLRVSPSLNNQLKGIRWAATYEVTPGVWPPKGLHSPLFDSQPTPPPSGVGEEAARYSVA